jgi:hypothetical protein
MVPHIYIGFEDAQVRALSIHRKRDPIAALPHAGTLDLRNGTLRIQLETLR